MWHDWCHPGLCIASGQRSAITGTVHRYDPHPPAYRLPGAVPVGKDSRVGRSPGRSDADGSAVLRDSEPNHTSGHRARHALHIASGTFWTGTGPNDARTEVQGGITAAGARGVRARCEPGARRGRCTSPRRNVITAPGPPPGVLHEAACGRHLKRRISTYAYIRHDASMTCAPPASDGTAPSTQRNPWTALADGAPPVRNRHTSRHSRVRDTASGPLVTRT